MKKYNLFKVISIMIILTLVLSWVFPTTYYAYDLVEGERAQIGLFDILKYPSVSLSFFGNMIIYLLAVGGFYGVLNKIDAYKTMLDVIAKKAEGKKNLLLSLIIIILTVLTSVCGAGLGLWVVVPFIISLVLLMGYDKITAALVTIGSIATGFIGTTLSSTYIVDQYNVSAQNGMGVINSILNTNAFDLIWIKVIVLVIGIIALIVCTLLHIKKAKNRNEIKEAPIIFETEEQESEKEQKNKKVRIWPMVLVFDLVFIITILSLTSWSSVFESNFFSKVTEYLLTKFQIGGMPIIGKILGSVPSFESWTVSEVSVLLFLASLLLGLLYRLKPNDFIESFGSGMKKFLKPAGLLVLIYTVLVMVSYHPFVLTIVKPLLSETFNVAEMSLTAFVTSVFNVDMYYAASSTLPYVTQLIVDTGVYPLIALVWQVMYGLMLLIAPTSIVLMPILSYLDISYGKWLKSSYNLVISIFLSSLIIMTIVMLRV